MWMLLANAAMAADPVWGVGGHVGTKFIPGAYPLAFPPKITSYDFDEDAEGLADNVDGQPGADATTLDKVRADFAFGATGHYWLGHDWRLGMTGDLDFGTRFRDVALVITFDRSIDLERALLVVGGGLGFGDTVWRGEDEDERLHLPNYPLRAQVGTILPVSDFVGISGTLFGQMAIPGRHDYTDVGGNEQDIGGVPFTYTTLGIELGGVYGQLR
ncbi:MAG: hypothetical protein ABMA64_11685 [Myxococcota bacterium]